MPDTKQAMQVMAESHRETVAEKDRTIEKLVDVLEYYAAPMTWVHDETGYSDADKYTNTMARDALEEIVNDKTR